MPKVAETLYAVDAALEAEEFERALSLADAGVREHPDDPDLHAAYAESLWALGDLADARGAYEEAVRLAPRAWELWADLARLLYELADFAASKRAAEHSAEIEASPEVFDLLCLLADREGDFERADACARRAHALAPKSFPLPVRLSAEEFSAAVREALDEIPERFQEALQNEVAILVEPVPALEILNLESPPLDPQLLGLYVGVPLPERKSATMRSDLPDRIYLFQRNLEHETTSRDELVEQIRITLFHEVGHYFGFSDEDLEERDFG
ncbi:MAG: metallopeptidase family protein [Candidatus Latescibacterota bacterium]|nr:MAG: metallopeptidase family protein [Candidatus Latescibacterota bacterium]